MNGKKASHVYLNEAPIRGTLPGTVACIINNVMVFMICALGMWILKKCLEDLSIERWYITCTGCNGLCLPSSCVQQWFSSFAECTRTWIFAHKGACGFWTMVRSGTSQKSLSHCALSGDYKETEKGNMESTKYYDATCSWWNRAGITTIGTFHIRIHTLWGPYRSDPSFYGQY
jgi:hypothetical protein